MARTSKLAAFAALRKNRDFTKLLAMMLLSFLVIFVVGVLRPIRDAIALDGLEPGDFYQVYFVSAIVVLFVPIYNRLADRIRWKELIPAVALFFAASMVVFRFLYLPGSAVFGMAFYGWYDLMVAALVTQFFMATQLFYNARDAKRAYPLVIAAGSVGAAVGGGITAFFSQRVGTANLLLVAGAAIVLFAVGITLVWRREDPDAGRPRERNQDEQFSSREFRRIFSNRQVQLIATSVLLTVLVKQFVDYQYKTLTREVFQDLDRVSGFLGLVDAATQWLPIIVLLSLRPILRRWGAGVTVLIFPTVMILATGALATVLTLPVAVMARTGERMFRYSAERTGREILYVPVPDNIRLKAKAYIDVAVEKGLGKVLSAVIILLLVLATGSMSIMNRLALIGFIGLGAAVVLLFVFLRVRREYVRSLAASIEGRFASLRGTYIPLVEQGTRRMVREALASGEPLKAAFALDLIEQGDDEDVAPFADELTELTASDTVELRLRALDILARAPLAVEESVLRERLTDDSARVRERAVRALVARIDGPADELFGELLDHPDAQTRAATLSCLRGTAEPELAARVVGPIFARHLETNGDADQAARLELAVAAGMLPGDEAATQVVRRLLEDDEDEVARAAVASAARLGGPELTSDVIQALGPTGTREAARDALARQGEAVLQPLMTALSVRTTDPTVRRNVPSVLGEIPTDATVDALIEAYMLPETEQVLDNRALGALSRLRAATDLSFPEGRVLKAVGREVDSAERYSRARVIADSLPPATSVSLLRRALAEAISERREGVFRWLGLLYSQGGMYRSYLAIEGGEDRPRANALEWLESTVGHTLFMTLDPALGTGEAVDGDGGGLEELRRLWDDEDVWLARLAVWACYDTAPAETLEHLAAYAPGDPGLQRSVTRLRRRPTATVGQTIDPESDDMDLIEKVFLLQNVDLLGGARSQQLALLASIANELEVDADQVLISREEPADALYVVIDGEVALGGVAGKSITVEAGAAFGTWALIDREASLLEAKTTRPCRLLKIRQSEFRDLLVDYPELALDLLQGLARRMRALAASA